MRIRNQKDFWAGLLFIAFGAFFSGFGAQYTLGTAEQMGPGYFPTILGVITILFGVYIAATGLSPANSGERVGRFPFRAILLILGSVTLFGLLLETLGLILSLFILIAVSSLASHEFSWKATLANAAVLISGSLAVFVWALNLQFELFPTFLGN